MTQNIRFNNTFIIYSMICNCDCIYSFSVLLMMVAESTRNLYSNFAVNNKDDCLKLNHVVYLINRVMMHGATNTKGNSSRRVT
jgi:hypothetical protein